MLRLMRRIRKLSGIPPSTATNYIVIGPASGPVNVESADFTITPDGVYSGTITVTPSGGGLGTPGTPIDLAWSSSSSPQTFTITPTSTGVVTLAFSSTLTDVSDMTYRSQTLVQIDSTWRAGNATTYGSSASDGPWALDQEDTYYQLTEDLTVPGTGMIIVESHVTFDLNGHTLTYNNASPLVVPNGDFDSDSIGSHTITDWDVSGASNSTFTVAANDVFLNRPQVLNWVINSGTTPQIIKSANISGITAGHTYCAEVEESGRDQTGYVNNLEIEVRDATTDDMSTFQGWRRTDTGGLDQAPCPSFSFIPTTTHSVYIRITMTPALSTGASAKITRVLITQSADYGVMATPADIYWLNPWFAPSAYGGDGQASGLENLPSAIQAVSNQAFAPIITDSVGTGSVTQGQAAGTFCHNINFVGAAGAMMVDGVHTYTNGDDTIPVNANNDNTSLTDSTNFRTVQNCTLDYYNSGPITGNLAGLGPIVLFRSVNVPALDVAGYSGALVQGCTITGNTQVGIRVSGAGPGIIQTIRNNTLHPNAAVTNCQAISIGGNNIKCLNNTVDCSTSGATRGIAVGDGPNSNVEVIGNTIISREYGNREYGAFSAPPRALEIRAYPDPPYGPMDNIRIHDNTFVAITSVGLMTGAIAARIVWIPADSSVTLTNNVLKAICVGTTDPGSQYYARAVEIDLCDVAASSPIIFDGNTFEANGIGIALGGPATGPPAPVNNIIFFNSILKNTDDPTAISRTFIPYYFGDLSQSVSGIEVIDSTYENGAPSALDFVGNGVKDAEFGYTARVTVLTSGAVPAFGATITIEDNFSTFWPLGVATTTDCEGLIVVPVPVTKYSSSGYDQNATPVTTSLLPVTLTATSADSLHTGTAVISAMTDDQSITITLD